MNVKNRPYKSNRKKNKLLYAVCELVKEKCNELNSFIGDVPPGALKTNNNEGKS